MAKVKSVTKSARLPEALVDKVDKAAKKEGRTFSNMLVRILESWEDGQEKAA